MKPSAARTLHARAPDNELYDAGCSLVEAAAAIRAAAAAPEAAQAVPAVLGCIESALRELGCACAALEATAARFAAERPGGCTGPRATGRAARMRRGFTNLRHALADAGCAAAAGRSLAARGIAAGAGVGRGRA